MAAISGHNLLIYCYSQGIHASQSPESWTLLFDCQDVMCWLQVGFKSKDITEPPSLKK